MVLGFGIIVLAALLLDAGITGRGLGEVIRGEIGRGFAFANIQPPSIQFISGATPVTGGTDGTVSGGGLNSIQGIGGAKGIVDKAAAAASQYGTIVVSSYRPGATTTSGNTSDHSSNDDDQAARDIGQSGVDAHVGPPTRALDQASVVVGQLFGRHYTAGQRIIDTFHWQGFRVQIIWRTPLYGGHMGHIHIGVKKD